MYKLVDKRPERSPGSTAMRARSLCLKFVHLCLSALPWGVHGGPARPNRPPRYAGEGAGGGARGTDGERSGSHVDRWSACRTYLI